MRCVRQRDAPDDLAPLGVLYLHCETIVAFAHHPIGKLILFGAVALPAWHAAHRLRMTPHDLGLGAASLSRQPAMVRPGCSFRLPPAPWSRFDASTPDHDFLIEPAEERLLAPSAPRGGGQPMDDLVPP